MSALTVSGGLLLVLTVLWDAELRGTYEPYANTLAAFLLMPLPAWVPPVRAKDNWQTTGLIRE